MHDSMRGLRDLVGNLQRDSLNSMTISVNQVTRPNLQATQLNGAAEIEDVRIGVRHGYAASKHLESGKPDLVYVTDGSIGNQSQAS
jgi:hypothetical protein